MSQTSLDTKYAAGYVGGRSWIEELELLRDAVRLLGQKEVAWELEVTGPALADALAERDRKRVAAEWTHVIVAMLARRDDEVAQELARTIIGSRASSTTFVVVEGVPLTPEEEAAIERLVEQMRRRKKAQSKLRKAETP